MYAENIGEMWYDVVKLFLRGNPVTRFQYWRTLFLFRFKCIPYRKCSRKFRYAFLISSQWLTKIRMEFILNFTYTPIRTKVSKFTNILELVVSNKVCGLTRQQKEPYNYKYNNTGWFYTKYFGGFYFHHTHCKYKK